jgi:hypothetical protein
VPTLLRTLRSISWSNGAIFRFKTVSDPSALPAGASGDWLWPATRAEQNPAATHHSDQELSGLSVGMTWRPRRR